ncbi:MAG: SDR family NAD(P)-dependent oxidoreductase [bacterium]|nr:SDR family NAD(P)-dependent oxidoreductase [bacterium]
MRYFVTGATGFIGGRLARVLLEHGHQVVIVARTPGKAAALQALGAEVHQGDITDRESLRAPMQGADGVFHVAGWYKVGVRNTAPGQAINVEGTRHVLSMMQELAIPKGVYTSTLAINSDTDGRIVDETYHFNGSHISEYDRTKAEAHYIADAFIRAGLPLVIVQPGIVYGPGDESSLHDTFQQYLKGQLPMLIEGTAFSWAHVDDIVEAHILAMDKGRPGESYIIAGDTHTLVEAIGIAQAITHVKPPALVLPRSVVKAMSAFMRVFSPLPLPTMLNGEYLRVSAATYTGSNAKARRELGHNPRPLREGLIPTLAWEMEQAGKTAKP